MGVGGTKQDSGENMIKIPTCMYENVVMEPSSQANEQLKKIIHTKKPDNRFLLNTLVLSNSL